MSIIKLIAYLIYKANKESKYGYDVPIANTAMGLTLLTILTVLPFLITFNVSNYIFSFNEKNRGGEFVKTGIILCPLIILYALLVKSFDLEKAKYDEQKVSRAWVYLGVYIFLAIFMIILSVFYRKGMLFK